MPRGTVRREVRIAVPAEEAWALVGAPERLPEWFPGITEAAVDGDSRVITMRSGLPMPEQIVTRDPILRRFQYRITAPVVVEHLSSIDVFDLGPDSCLVAYSCDADPATMALIIGGAAGNALEHLRDLLEGRA
ncbi:MAG TPA: SRPBCC family protein [Acidimicrobiales bacterium]